MKILDASKLRRDPSYFKKMFSPKDEGEIVNEDVNLLFPTRFVDIGIASLEKEVKTPCIYSLISNEKYAVSTIPVAMNFIPSKIEIVEVNEVQYYQLSFKKGGWFTKNSTVIKADTMMFDIYKEFMTNGRIPFYLNYDDIATVFNNARRYAGSNAGDDHTTIDMLISIIARDPKDLNNYYRNTDMKEPFVPIGLSNVTVGYQNTVSKITGSYLRLGLTSTLTQEPKKVIEIEKILRA